MRSAALQAKKLAQYAIDAAAAAAAGANAAATPTPAGTPAGQSGAQFSFLIYATTTNAATTAVDTGYSPPNGHAAHLDGAISLTDVAAATALAKNLAATIRRYAGTTAVAGTPIVSGSTGDTASLGTATITFSISGGGTVVLTFTPPGGYVGTIRWIVSMDALEN